MAEQVILAPVEKAGVRGVYHSVHAHMSGSNPTRHTSPGVARDFKIRHAHPTYANDFAAAINIASNSQRLTFAKRSRRRLITQRGVHSLKPGLHVGRVVPLTQQRSRMVGVPQPITIGFPGLTQGIGPGGHRAGGRTSPHRYTPRGAHRGCRATASRDQQMEDVTTHIPGHAPCRRTLLDGRAHQRRVVGPLPPAGG